MPDVSTHVTKAATADSIVTREVNDEETKLIEVPISSTRADRDGDEFSLGALEGMADQISREQPKVFQNHGFTELRKPLYDDRETIGTHMDAEVVALDDGDEDAVLNALILPDTTHSEGERLLKQVEQGHAEKFSVAFAVHEASPKNPDQENDERRIFEAVDHMETSKVGIPANPDASAAADVAAKAAGLAQTLGAAGVDIEDEEAFASALASELVSASGPVTAEDVRHATPTAVDGDAEVTTRVNERLRQLATDQLEKSTDNGDGIYIPNITTGDDGEKPSRRDVLDQLKRDAEAKGACDDDADCPDGETCVDGECVDEETDSFTMDDEADERFAQLEATVTDLADSVESLTETIDESLSTEPGEPDDDGKDAASDGLTDDEREQLEALQAKAEEADAAESETTTAQPDQTDDSDDESDDGAGHTYPGDVIA